MTGTTSDAQIDQLVKAGWLAIGLSPRDLANVLDAALSQPAASGDEFDRVGAERLMEVAEALDISLDLRRANANAMEPTAGCAAPSELPGSLRSLLELRLLRAFCQLEDRRTKLMLVHLAEQIARRQANRTGDAS
jgi:hypothetical protein